MHVITKKRLVEFGVKHPEAELPLLRWYKVANKADWKNVSDVKSDFPRMDVVGKFMVFDIGGNKFRLIVTAQLKYGKLYIRNILTHKEYDKEDWKKQ